jgi:hypothetical protein
LLRNNPASPPILLTNHAKKNALDLESKNELRRLFQGFNADEYKDALGLLLSLGIKQNLFNYPAGQFPPPTPARAYIKRFLTEQKDLVSGRVIEFAPSVYKSLVMNEKVTDYDIWNVTPSSGVTIVGDIQDPSILPDESVDTILLTHVLSAIKNPKLAIENISRFLCKNGTILCTVPVVLQKFAPDPQDFWRFTKDSLEELFSSMSIESYKAYGNAATASGSTQYLMDYHFEEDVLFENDPHCPSVIAAVVRK